MPILLKGWFVKSVKNNASVYLRKLLMLMPTIIWHELFWQDLCDIKITQKSELKIPHCLTGSKKQPRHKNQCFHVQNASCPFQPDETKGHSTPRIELCWIKLENYERAIATWKVNSLAHGNTHACRITVVPSWRRKASEMSRFRVFAPSLASTERNTPCHFHLGNPMEFYHFWSQMLPTMEGCWDNLTHTAVCKVISHQLNALTDNTRPKQKNLVIFSVDTAKLITTNKCLLLMLKI